MTRDEAIERVKALGWAPSYAEDHVKVLVALNLLKLDEPEQEREPATPDTILTGLTVSVVEPGFAGAPAERKKLTAHSAFGILRVLHEAGYVVRKKAQAGGPIEDALVEALADTMLKVGVVDDHQKLIGRITVHSARLIYRHLHDMGFVISRSVER